MKTLLQSCADASPVSWTSVLATVYARCEWLYSKNSEVLRSDFKAMKAFSSQALGNVLLRPIQQFTHNKQCYQDWSSIKLREHTAFWVMVALWFIGSCAVRFSTCIHRAEHTFESAWMRRPKREHTLHVQLEPQLQVAPPQVPHPSLLTGV